MPLVMNDTRVLPARIYGEKIETGAHLEILLLNNIEGDSWETLIKPAKRAKSRYEDHLWRRSLRSSR